MIRKIDEIKCNVCGNVAACVNEDKYNYPYSFFSVDCPECGTSTSWHLNLNNAKNEWFLLGREYQSRTHNTSIGFLASISPRINGMRDSVNTMLFFIEEMEKEILGVLSHSIKNRIYPFDSIQPMSCVNDRCHVIMMKIPKDIAYPEIDIQVRSKDGTQIGRLYVSGSETLFILSLKNEYDKEVFSMFGLEYQYE